MCREEIDGQKGIKGIPFSLEELHKSMNEDQGLTCFGRTSCLISTRCEMAFAIDAIVSVIKTIF
jgi:hypothetical protein